MSASDLASLRVLLVDDEPFQIKLLGAQMAQIGVGLADGCGDAREALAWIEREPDRFDLVCCDLQMPQMDGIEFVRHLGVLGFRGALLLVSGEDSRMLRTTDRLARQQSLRVLGALKKPVLPDDLRSVLHACGRVTSRAAPPILRTYTAAEVRQAIDQHQLVNHYQPKVDLATGQLAGVETLVRWQHPQEGLVGPDRFIGIAEEHGLIDNLTRCVLAGLAGALQQARQWQDIGYPISVAVNVSMDNLIDHAFPDFVTGALAQAGVLPSRLTLEVTESRLMHNPTATLDIMARLRLRRIGLSIDDFGTGHSSLAQLRDVPFDELKIDRSFVRGVHARADLQAIVTASLHMARQLELKTVAEGVETLEDWQFLRRCGCDLAQGWFIARPMPPAELVGWLADWETRRGFLVD